MWCLTFRVGRSLLRCSPPAKVFLADSEIIRASPKTCVGGSGSRPLLTFRGKKSSSRSCCASHRGGARLCATTDGEGQDESRRRVRVFLAGRGRRVRRQRFRRVRPRTASACRHLSRLVSHDDDFSHLVFIVPSDDDVPPRSRLRIWNRRHVFATHQTHLSGSIGKAAIARMPAP